MKANKIIALLLAGCMAAFCLSACTDEKVPDFSGFKERAELATLKCTFHNVAEIRNDGTDILFGINVGYKKAWFEYDGIVNLGVDVEKVEISDPDANGVVTIAVPDAQVLGLPDVDESSFSDIYQDTGLLTGIDIVDQVEALKTAQEEMKKSAENNVDLMSQAKDRAETLLGQYVQNIGQSLGQVYEIKFVDAK
ncbi:DUF4230 domain-containing protein [Eggerthellaceae bacterium zg-887]|uniref:DUF4230 domain-containing protein n=1 Tax=Xiamenia xianingshaonis TaxID=2682776 RepID=UPI00140CAE44|nr:DUF4230 domain-containing protein [Xiamenia xianingshaonis]NHM16470.1 DUF4230 domain-containing protein [Xiamenia xianingshaonis]